ncbi:glycoside hydrolase family 127 protein [Rhodocytophaga aerolata]|uniref:Glycoside hydrolase family 127 protein n=1 Tax=Rhodocytophaga aerolata TaxID=455078 RepID=A0ABT8R8S5_9BACT|nr:glycoside hydrolase family 127 protein [Rhodocytophaga aerolata]MDO1448500.1 glycoside hydrolase family 127 protein [Rhodocytophaga aerolata]
MRLFIKKTLLLFPSLLSASLVISQDYPINPVEFTQVHLQSRFWSPRLDTNQKVTIPFAFQKCEETGRIDNFAIAGGLKEGKFKGIAYDDSDVFKVMEAAAYSLAIQPDKKLDAYLDDLITKVAAAQEPDGYLYTIRTIHQKNPAQPIDQRAGNQRWSNLQDSHELYNVGHMYEAAVAHYLATGKKNFLNVAIKNADFLANTFGEGKKYGVPGHEEIEIGLVKLYRVTGNKSYLELAKFFIDQRGNHQHRKMYIADWANPVDSAYYQDHIPVTQQKEPVGHVVRAGYLYSGMADVAAITGEQSYITAINQIWDFTFNKKMYVTGGLGAERGTEGFGKPYDLPNLTAYNETCAALASMLWNYRLFLLSGNSQYLDVFERTLYNGFLSGVSLEGNLFFYPNPLEADGQQKFNHGHATRSSWFSTSCCPTNVARFLPSLPGYVYATKANDIYANLFVAGTGTIKTANQQVQITQQTDYPWNGQVTFTLQPEKSSPFAFHIRIPGWATNQPVPGDLYSYTDSQKPTLTITVNKKPAKYQMQNGFAVLNQVWKKGDNVELTLSMPIRQVISNQQVEENRGKVALERGPLVYCVEGVDNGGSIANAVVSRKTKLTAELQPKLLHGIMVLKASDTSSKATKPEAIFTAIPYYAWSHRGAGEMAVWLQKQD